MLNYNTGGATSDIDGAGSSQTNTFFWLKKALITARKEQYFMPLASVTNMPKHYGKTIKVYEYVPLLDDRNANDQGLDAAGAIIANGNLYGSSKDIGNITSKLPTLTENGGRVNRVGFTRLQREGSITKFGFFHEFTQESLDFDSDSELMDHLSRELVTGATQLTEAVLQKDLLANAGVVIYAGAAVSNATMTGEGTESLVSYANLMRLDQTLTDNRTPRQTTVITGSRLVDTKTIPAARVMFIGSELVPVVKGMKDLFNNPAFIPVQQYGDAGTVLNGEIGTVDAFRIVQVPEMLHWADVGAAVTGANEGYRNTGGNYNVYPMLCVGDDSFTTIGFQTDGKTVKFSVMTKMPGRETADRNDPYGETGFSSIKWYYGVLIKRPERIGLIKTVAPL
jgi:N4-gp56 family major capsid protein